MTKPVAVLFPEPNAPEGALKVILAFFESVKICRPWFMEESVPFLESGRVHVLYPPDDLKPSGDFKKLLVEYRTWIRTSHNKGFDAFLAFKEQRSHGEEASWEIRADLRRKQAGPEEERRILALKWNLTLHLAHEIQEKGKEAEDLLRGLKGKDSPLKGVIEEREHQGLLSDLPEEEGTPFLSEAEMSQVLVAWFSLFGGHLTSQDALLTLSSPVFQYLCDTWQEWGEGPGEDSALGGQVTLRHFPLPKKSPSHAIAKNLSGRTMGLVRSECLYGK